MFLGERSSLSLKLHKDELDVANIKIMCLGANKPPSKSSILGKV